jgi:hypothetical protein
MSEAGYASSGAPYKKNWEKLSGDTFEAERDYGDSGGDRTSADDARERGAALPQFFGADDGGDHDHHAEIHHAEHYLHQHQRPQQAAQNAP